jgi:hypothetical protein
LTTEIWDEAFIDETNIDESDIEDLDDLTIQGSDDDDTSKKSNKKRKDSELSVNHVKMLNKKVHFKKSGGSFQHEWLNIYKWLKYDAATKRMFCTICKAHGEKNQFAGKGNK